MIVHDPPGNGQTQTRSLLALCCCKWLEKLWNLRLGNTAAVVCHPDLHVFVVPGGVDLLPAMPAASILQTTLNQSLQGHLESIDRRTAIRTQLAFGYQRGRAIRAHEFDSFIEIGHVVQLMLVRAVHGIEMDESGLVLFAVAHADGGFSIDLDLPVDEVMPLAAQRTFDLEGPVGPRLIALLVILMVPPSSPMASER